ncbi:MAG TPA: exodeoxyribonuclease V subunit gamma [Rudaea sp.]|nr:exodeoxyribonuclease V subunit gamma [Rudaea sp.]
MNSLIVHRASRTERLADELIDLLRRDRPSNPLAPQAIVIPHAGMRRWLLQIIARISPAGIAANFDTQLPWQWLQQTAKRVLGDEALVAGDYNTESLRWHIYRALASSRAAAIENYIGGNDSERRRFQLAAHLADVFTQYLVYRPETILAWERGAETKDWQAGLWRTVRKHIDKPHRAERKELLVAELAKNGDGESLPLHVFGVSHLAPDVLECLRAVAAHRSVHVYFPDPCREHWDYLRKKRSVLATADAESLYFDVGHPLLASLGRVGQDFSLALDDAGEHRDALDEGDVPETASNLLDALQTSIRVLEPDYVRNASKPAVRDTSLRVHACHTRLRELEVLKDQLLGFLADDTSLQPRDIVVMAPDIAAYAPFLPSVFGPPARYSDDAAQIPWHLADVALAGTHALFTGFSKLLDLGESRFRVSDVIDLLDVAAIARRFGLSEETRSRLEPWLRQARVAWGLDARMKEQVGGAPIDANTWMFGFDRLYAGMIAGDDTGETLVDGVLPVAGVSGNDIDAIGRLDRFIETLRDLRDDLAIERPLAAWSVWLLDLVDALFAIDVRDDVEDTAMSQLRRTIAALGDQDDALGGENLPWSVVRDVVRGALDAISERQPFLLGGVTFCGLVPQRSIPFRVVCLLGMNEGEYPRIASDSGLNRMQTYPRRGDRDTRNEDRYLFLEALMAARQHLHVSYLGEDIADGSRRNPASPLSELLEFLDDQFSVQQQSPADARPWLIHHPLQPFDNRYYARGAQLFSFDAAYAVPTGDARTSPSFVDVDDDAPARAPESNNVSLKSLKAFWRDPSRARLRDTFGIGLDALGDDALLDREPMTASTEKRERFEAQLLDRAWDDGLQRLPDAAPAWLARSGALPGGEVGARAYARMRARVQPMLTLKHKQLGDSEPVVVAIDLPIGDARLVGTVDTVFRQPDGTLHVFHAKPHGAMDFRDLVPFYVDWAVLRLSQPNVLRADVFECADGAKNPRAPKLIDAIVSQDPRQLRAGLGELLNMTRHATNAPPLFFPKTAWAWSSAPADERRDAEARKAWEGNGPRQKGEAGFEPGYAALAARDSEFLKHASHAHEKFVATNRWISRILDPDQTVLVRTGTRDDA